MMKSILQFARRPVCLRIAALLAVMTAISARADENRTVSTGSNSRAAETPESIKRLISDLSSPDYRTREEATQQLSKAGADAVGEVIRAAGADDLEVAFRAVRILQAMLKSDQSAVERQAADALQQLAEQKTAIISDVASDALSSYRVILQERAMVELRRLGAKVNKYDTDEPASVNDFLSVTLGAAKWRGDKSDFALLKSLPNLYEIGIYGIKVDEDMARVMADLPTKPAQFNLFGTRISDAALNIMREKSRAKIVLRNGAMLGVKSLSLIGRNGGPTCIIGEVQPGSAAENAGILAQDEILAFDGQPVATFEELTNLISTKNPSDTVTLDIRRDGTEIKKKVVLGQWD
jgi:hypothetical protein